MNDTDPLILIYWPFAQKHKSSILCIFCFLFKMALFIMELLCYGEWKIEANCCSAGSKSRKKIARVTNDDNFVTTSRARSSSCHGKFTSFKYTKLYSKKLSNLHSECIFMNFTFFLFLKFHACFLSYFRVYLSWF